MKRRELLVAAGGIAAAAALGKLEGTALAAEHRHDNHARNAGVVDTALDCVKTAEACLNHCLDVLATGDTSLANCAKSVTELKIYCTALYQAGLYNSGHLKEIAAISEKVCGECEKECRKHSKHKTCSDCADACARCIKECRKMAG